MMMKPFSFRLSCSHVMLLIAAQVCLQLFSGKVADGYNAYRPLMTRSRALASTSLGMGAGDVNDSPDISRGKKLIAVASLVDKFTQQSPSISYLNFKKKNEEKKNGILSALFEI